MVKNRRPWSLSSARTAIRPATVQKDIKEWDESRCPVCLDYPHNSVLLLCSSHEKGCRPYMCDTSYRHSNCLDQFRKVSNGDENRTLTCPLCRGMVEKWVVVSAAREYMDVKVRSCSKEGCGFSGNYVELRNHARMEHPFVRPSEVDPLRELEWRRMVQLQDIEDAIGSIRVQLNGADEVNLSDIVDDIHLSFWADANVTEQLVSRLFGDGRASLMSMTTARPGVQTSQLRRTITLPTTSMAPLEGQRNRARQTRSPLPSENAIIVGDEPNDRRSQSPLASTNAVIVGDEPRGRRDRSPLPGPSAVLVGDELSDGRRRSSLPSVNAVIVEDEPSGRRRRRRRRRSPSWAEAQSVELLSVVDRVVIEESNTDESDENVILQERGRRQRQRQRRMRRADEDDIF